MENFDYPKFIELKVKSHYGKTSYYPTCEDGRTMVRILGTKTLPEWAMIEFNKLGYVFCEYNDSKEYKRGDLFKYICKDGKFSNKGE